MIGRQSRRDPFDAETGEILKQGRLPDAMGGYMASPVAADGKLVGIITATDILRAFIDMMGILRSTSRIDVVVGDQPGGFKKAH